MPLLSLSGSSNGKVNVVSNVITISSDTPFDGDTTISIDSVVGKINVTTGGTVETNNTSTVFVTPAEDDTEFTFTFLPDITGVIEFSINNDSGFTGPEPFIYTSWTASLDSTGPFRPEEVFSGQFDGVTPVRISIEIADETNVNLDIMYLSNGFFQVRLMPLIEPGLYPITIIDADTQEYLVGNITVVAKPSVATDAITVINPNVKKNNIVSTVPLVNTLGSDNQATNHIKRFRLHEVSSFRFNRVPISQAAPKYEPNEDKSLTDHNVTFATSNQPANKDIT
jgi:hypothetical protein